MKRKVLPLLAVTVALMLMAACQEARSQVAAPGPDATGDEPEIALVPYADLESGFTGIVPAGWVEFSIHLLADEVPATEMSSLDLSAIKLQDEAIVSAEDIISYSRSTHEIELTAGAYARIQQLFELPVRVSGMPFVVSVGSDRIYAGAFWTPASSLSFDGVVILEPFDPDQRVIRIALGYPSPQAFTGQDPRSDERILRSLQATGKLAQ